MASVFPSQPTTLQLSLLQSQDNADINASNTEFLSVRIHCQPKYSSYFSNRGYETIEISQNYDSESETLFRIDDLLWIELPEVSQIESLLDSQHKNVILKMTGTNIHPIERLIENVGEERVRVIAVDCSNNEPMWNERLRRTVIWDDYEIEKLVHRGKFFVTNEIAKKVRYFEVIDNDSSLEEGLDRLLRALKRARVHAEDVQLYYNTKHESLQYLQSLNIQELLEHLMTQLLIEQPDSPKEYLIEYLTQIKNNSQKTGIFTTEDLEAMFQMIDLTGQGKISKSQFRNALKNLTGQASNNEQNAVQGGKTVVPPNEEKIGALLSGVADEVDQDTFVKVSKSLMEVEFS